MKPHFITFNNIDSPDNGFYIPKLILRKPGVHIWDGITLVVGSYMESNVTFTNDQYQKSKNKNFILQKIIVKKASIGENTTFLGGITIGENSLTGAGSVVTKNVPTNEVWLGNPAKYLKNI